MLFIKISNNFHGDLWKKYLRVYVNYCRLKYMNKSLLTKLTILLMIIAFNILPQPHKAAAEAEQCCDINCGVSAVDKMACPSLKESHFCKSNSLECCKEECLYSSKDKIILNKRMSFQRFSHTLLNPVPFSSFHVSLDQQPFLFYEYQQNKTQNHPLFSINSVFLI